jgi:hypothetical protein
VIIAIVGGTLIDGTGRLKKSWKAENTSLVVALAPTIGLH